MGDVPHAPSDLFFETLSRGYTDENPRFLRRDWLAQRLAAELRDDTGRFILLKGEPGAGKSVFMAQLAGDNPAWLRYFIRRDQQRAASSVSNKSFLLHIGFQLACLHRELFTQEQLRVSVKMGLREVTEGGEAVGAEVKRLVASPFYTKVVESIRTSASTVAGMVGLKVDEMVANAHLLDSADLLNLALIDPARAQIKAQVSRERIEFRDVVGLNEHQAVVARCAFRRSYGLIHVKSTHACTHRQATLVS